MKRADKTTTRYYYNDQRVAVQTQVSGGVESDFRHYVFGNYIDEVLVMGYRLSSSWINFYYGHDHLYSPVVLYGPTGMVIERNEYDAYGSVQILTANYEPRTTSVLDNPYTFTGRELDTLDAGSLRLMHYRARTYDPETGRFMQRDPAEYVDGMNLYEYVRSNPINNFDPYGLMSNRIKLEPIDPKSVCPLDWVKEQYWEDRKIMARWVTLKYRVNLPWPLNIFQEETLWEWVNYQIAGYVPVSVKLIGTGPDGKWTDADMLLYVGKGYITPNEAIIKNLIKLNQQGKTYRCRRLYRCITECCSGMKTTTDFDIPGIMEPIDTSGFGSLGVGSCTPLFDPSVRCPVKKRN